MDYNAITFLPVLAVVTFARIIGSVNYQIKLVKVSHPEITRTSLGKRPKELYQID